MVVGQLEIQLLANMARLQSDMDKAKRTVGNAVGNINKVLGAIGVGISVDFLLGLAQKANEYSKSLAALSTQISGATNQINELDAASRNLSVQFGTSAIKQSAGFYEILSAGITDTTQATALLTEANRLAIGGNADLMVSVDGLTSIVKGYGSAAGTASEIADTLFTASLAGKLSIQELSQNIGKVIPLATTMGVSLEEVTAAISALTLGGISAKESVTGMRAIFAAVAKPTSQAAELAKQLGLEFNSAAIQANGFAKFLEDVKAKTKGSSDQMAILFGGVESLVPALALTGNAGVEFSNILGQMANKAGATEEAFNKMAASPGFKWDQFMATMSNIAITLGDVLANILTPAAEMAAKALNKLFGFSDATGVEKQIQLVGQLAEKVESMSNRRSIPIVGGLLFDKKEFDLLQHQLETAKSDLDSMQKAQQSVSVVQKQSTVEVIKNTVELEKNNSVVTKAVRVAETRNKEFNTELYLLRQYESEAKRARDITDSVATEQEIYNQKLDELNRLKPYLTVETYERALQKLNGTTEQTVDVTRTTVNEIDQLWVQAGRNIQSTLANSIFNFFDDGLKGMLKNVISTVGRIASEFAALRIAQGVGLSAMFAVPGSASAAGVGGTGMNALNIASLGSNAMSFMRGGFGIPAALSSVGGMLPGAAGSFFGAMGGTGAAAAEGASALWGASGLTGANAMGAAAGSAMAAAAGPLLAAFAATQLFKSFAGDKRLGGGFGKALNFVGDIPILGDFIPVVPLVNALFGRGPLKQRETKFIGEIGSAGQLDFGELVTNFKAKGGLFRSDKNDFAKVDLISGLASTDNNKALGAFTDSLIPYAKQLAAQINESIGSVNVGLRSVADTLNLSLDPLDNFRHSINLVSESGKALTDEQISEEIEAITESMARTLLPTVDQFSKYGENAVQTISRLGAEFSSLTQAAQNLGASVDYAKQLIGSLSIEARTAFLDNYGGTEKLLADSSSFGQLFLTEAERMAPAIKFVEDGLTSLGFSANITKDEFKQLVQTLLQSASESDQAKGVLLLQNNALFASVADYKNSIQEVTAKTEDLTEAQQDYIDSVNRTIRAMQLDSAANQIALINQEIDKLVSFADSLKSTVEQISPQSLDSARQQIVQATQSAKEGKVTDISAALATLSKQSTSGFTDSFSFARSKAQSVALIDQLSQAISGAIAFKQASIADDLRVAANRSRVPAFASGGHHRGGLRIVGERGPELERTGPSSITSNSDLKKSIGNDELLEELKKLNKTLDAVTQSGTVLRTRSVA